MAEGPMGLLLPRALYHRRSVIADKPPITEVALLPKGLLSPEGTLVPKGTLSPKDALLPMSMLLPTSLSWLSTPPQPLSATRLSHAAVHCYNLQKRLATSSRPPRLPAHPVSSSSLCVSPATRAVRSTYAALRGSGLSGSRGSGTNSSKSPSTRARR
ncbi:hypothetical protein CALVIDRAFT_411333 [Calocera viscosa TUFC12733]|uniref:Uncharacterized protein n=1 Tax=Calocera viscosa (strain TUFC12733) TaxID=1330018 RepID=A0A167G5Z5_CALVF|nr:hypothetical protein CALVIDRAFT_411333 [Calocera viscosa TUFC12733]